MDAFSDHLVTSVVLMFPSQTGKSEVFNNVTGYFIDQDPAPILFVEPTLELARAWSKDRIAPMLRDTPALNGKVKEPRTRDSGNTQLHKTFDGGHLTLCGANSAASLRARPVRIVLLDEIDGYPPSAGTEGEPCKLAEARARTFSNKKIGNASTPGIKDISRIEAKYEASDKRKYFVPCPHCGAFQVLMFKRLRWPDSKPEEAAYYCDPCGCEITDRDKPAMLRDGEWRAEKPFKGVAGFWINGLYSPWLTFAEIAVEWMEANEQKKRGNLEPLKVVINTILCETFEESGETVSDDKLFNRREAYGPKIPKAAVVLTAGADIQKDRIEVQVDAWGEGEERWNIKHHIIYGDPSQPPRDPKSNTPPNIWDELDDYLLKTYEHESGAKMAVACAAIDSNYLTDNVYKFVRPRQPRRVFAIRGSTQRDKPIVSNPTWMKHARIRLFNIGVHQGKQRVYDRLKVEQPGPGYVHFPIARTVDYFRQLTIEKLVTRYYKGHPRKEWILPSGERNEALDITVYSHAALGIIRPNLARLTAGGQSAARPRRRRGVISEGVK